MPDRRIYDEDEQLTDYVWHNYLHLIDEFERLVGKAIAVETKTTTSGDMVAQRLRERWGRHSDARISDALSEGPKAFRRKVRERLLAEHAEQIEVNRCPACERVVATPKARQCLWCGHDWHDLPVGEIDDDVVSMLKAVAEGDDAAREWHRWFAANRNRLTITFSPGTCLRLKFHPVAEAKRILLDWGVPFEGSDRFEWMEVGSESGRCRYCGAVVERGRWDARCPNGCFHVRAVLDR